MLLFIVYLYVFLLKNHAVAEINCDHGGEIDRLMLGQGDYFIVATKEIKYLRNTFFEPRRVISDRIFCVLMNHVPK